MNGVSMYECTVCETTQGIFYKWNEIDDEKEPDKCLVCGDGNLKHVGDKDLDW